MERNAVEGKVAELGPLFQNFQIASDVWTNSDGSAPGPQYPDTRWRLIEPMLPNVAGKAVLDVGCSSGFFSLKLKELGADYVLGVDSGEQPKAIDQARFAAEVLELDVDFKVLSAYDLRKLFVAEGSHAYEFGMTEGAGDSGVTAGISGVTTGGSGAVVRVLRPKCLAS